MGSFVLGSTMHMRLGSQRALTFGFSSLSSDLSRGFVGLKLADLDGSAVVGATTTWIS